MFVATAKIVIPLPWAESLKEKRAVVRSLRDRLKRRYNLSVAEVDKLNDRRRIVLGIACVGVAPGPLERTLEGAFSLVQGSVEGDVFLEEREVL